MKVKLISGMYKGFFGNLSDDSEWIVVETLGGFVDLDASINSYESV